MKHLKLFEELHSNTGMLFCGLKNSDESNVVFNGEEQEKNKQESKYSITKLVDWLPAWNGYPKRTHSIFMSNSPKYASNWVQKSGSLYECKAEGKLGLCPGYDFNDLSSWPHAVSLLMPEVEIQYLPFTINQYDAFAGKTVEHLVGTQLDWWLKKAANETTGGDLGVKLVKMLDDVNLKHYNLNPYIQRNLKKLDTIIATITREEYYNGIVSSELWSLKHFNKTKLGDFEKEEVEKLMYMFDLVKKYGSLRALIEEAFDPIKNGFSIVSQKEIPAISGDKNIREAWTDSKVILKKIPSIKVKQTFIGDK